MRNEPRLFVTDLSEKRRQTIKEEIIAMKMKNVRVIAVNRELEDGFNIYLDFSGRREYLLSHRHNGIMYEILKDGISVEKLKRTKPHQLYTEYGFRFTGRNSSKLERQLNHLNDIIEEYLNEIIECEYGLDAA